jgi:hypothetical protein
VDFNTEVAISTAFSAYNDDIAQVATADGRNINRVASALVSSFALYSSIGTLTVADVTNTILTGSTLHTYDLGIWFGDHNGVTETVDLI